RAGPSSCARILARNTKRDEHGVSSGHGSRELESAPVGGRRGRAGRLVRYLPTPSGQEMVGAVRRGGLSMWPEHPWLDDLDPIQHAGNGQLNCNEPVRTT